MVGGIYRIEFHGSIEFPTEWDTSKELVNLDDELLEGKKKLTVLQS